MCERSLGVDGVGWRRDLQLSTSEPHCEVVIAKTVPEINGNLAAAKNPRRLHLPFTGGAKSIVAELNALAKAAIPKDQLAGHLPEESVRLSADERATLQSWLSARYRRAAFPDVFDRRLKEGKEKFFDKFADIIKKTGPYLLAVYFDHSPEDDAPADVPYDLTIDLVYNVAEDPEKAQ